MEAVYYTKSEAQTRELGKRLAGRLAAGDNVLFFGELGAGKTQFIKGLAEGLGVEQLVKSPTFAYVNRYVVEAIPAEMNWGPMGPYHEKRRKPRVVFYHYDLYRMQSGDELTSLGYEETLHQPDAINAVEWADRLEGNLPESFVKVILSPLDEYREISMEFVSPSVVMQEQTGEFFNEWGTPAHVRDHCAQVTSVARQVAEAFIRGGDIVDMNLLINAAMLHDMTRICDFHELNRASANFKEEITDEKWNKWVALREKYAGRDHADLAYEALYAKGFYKTAEVVRLHKTTCLVLETDKFDTLEKVILYYADKRVLHNKIVSLAERFAEGRGRYGKFNDENTKKLYLKVEEGTRIIESNLFANLDIKPGDIV